MATTWEQWIQRGQQLGYQDEDLQKFVREQQTLERDDRARERAHLKDQEDRAAEKEKVSLELKERENQRKHEVEMAKLNANKKDVPDRDVVRAKAPKLPNFNEERDNMDAYLDRFERFADSQKWKKELWALNLSALLTGQALDVYSRMSPDVANNYDKLKEALLLRYDMTRDGFRRKFREGKIDKDESPVQYVSKLKRYANRWVEMSKITKNYDQLMQLFVREQFIDTCDKSLAEYLNRHPDTSLDNLATLAQQYLEAAGRPFVGRKQDKNPDVKKCHKCGKVGHTQRECRSNGAVKPKPEVKCSFCGKNNHTEDKMLAERKG